MGRYEHRAPAFAFVQQGAGIHITDRRRSGVAVDSASADGTLKIVGVLHRVKEAQEMDALFALRASKPGTPERQSPLPEPRSKGSDPS